MSGGVGVRGEEEEEMRKRGGEWGKRVCGFLGGGGVGKKVK